MKKITLKIIVLALVAITTVQAGDRRGQHNKNYILRRQEAYQVQGVPTSRLIIGKREIDVYPNGMMFEKDNLVGVRSK
jgi:hypothetical protein